MSLRPTYQRIWGITYPIILAGVGETIVDITDTIFLARYGVTELAAVGLADAIFGVALFLSLGIVDGVQIIIGRRVGQGEQREIGRVFNQGVYLLMLASVAMVIMILFAVPLVTSALFASADVHSAVNRYLGIAAYALFFQSINLVYSAFYIGISKTRVLIAATVVLAITNILLDYALIFGNVGLPEMGIEGAALASLVAEVAAFLFLTQHVVSQGYVKRYGLLRFSRWSPEYARKLAVVSMPVSMEALVETLKWFLFFLIIEQLGEAPLASATIIFSCYALFMIPVDGFFETVCTMTSNLIGQQLLPQLNLLIRRAIKLGYLVIAPMLLISMLFPETVLSMFTPDEEIIEISSNSLFVVIVIMMLAVPGYTYYAALFGTGDTLMILMIQIIMTTVTVGVAYFCALHLQLALEFVWLAEMAGLSVCLLLSWFLFRKRNWQTLNI